MPPFIPARGQSLIQSSSGAIRIFHTDQAVLEQKEPRTDLPCTVTPNKALLGFDLRFHAGYEVAVPLRELRGSENLLTILFRVASVNEPDQYIYFTHRVRVPEIQEDAKGEAVLSGGFDVGQGQYKVDWLMRDRAERVCSSYWDVEAELPQKDKQIELVLAPTAVVPIESEQFREEPPVERAQGDAPLNVKVVMNFAPQNYRSATLKPVDTSALLSILRSISREPRIGKFSLTAFNIQQQKVMFRQANADKIDFPRLGEAVSSLRLGTVDLSMLAQKDSETEFLTELIRTEMSSADHPDAIIFAGPKTFLESSLSPEDLKAIGKIDYPVFYMNYNLYPQVVPWRDAISSAVRFFKGQEYTISRPRDLWFAVSEMVGRIVKSRSNRHASSDSTQ